MVPSKNLDESSLFYDTDYDRPDSEASESNHNEKSTQTDPVLEQPEKKVRLRYASTSEKGGPKIPQTYTVESRSMQTTMSWSYIESLFQGLDTDNFERLKEGVALIQEEIVGEIKKGLPELRFYITADAQNSGGDESSEDLEINDNNKSNTKIESSHASKKEKETKAKDEPEKKTEGRKQSLAVELPSSRRTTSAHCLGGRKGTLHDLEENIFDVFKSRGENAQKVQPQILKYVGEKNDLRPEEDSVEKSYIRGWYDGLCQFCGEELYEIPTLDQIMDSEKATKIKVSSRDVLTSWTVIVGGGNSVIYIFHLFFIMM